MPWFPKPDHLSAAALGNCRKYRIWVVKSGTLGWARGSVIYALQTILMPSQIGEPATLVKSLDFGVT